MDFFPTIRMFLEQAATGSSTAVNNYPKDYDGFQVKVNFGKGNSSRIPRIVFVPKNQLVSNDYYPGFLYFKELDLLILSYIKNKTVKTVSNWQIPGNTESVRSYFINNGLGIAEKYGDSFISKVYSPISEIDPATINKDLEEVLSSFKDMQNFPVMNESMGIEMAEAFVLDKTENILSTGLVYSKEILYRYAISLLTKPFVILSGLSGSGKTQLALTFARWLSNDESEVKIVSVGADWNNREYLLGYPNALDSGKYIKPENGVLDFMIEANQNPYKPYFLVLDEMNLSYVERYFADFLSAMESDEPITLHPDSPEWADCDVPATIMLPANLYITGTINVDETTYMFSPKVLDRANVIEFSISEADMNNFLTRSKPVDKNKCNYQGASMGRNFIMISRENNFQKNEKINRMLLAFFTGLKTIGAEFGFRTASDIYRFTAIARKLNSGWNDDTIIDIAVMQKMLPKLHGSRKKIQPVLTTLWNLCLAENNTVMIENEDEKIDSRFRFPLSAAKIRRMFINARDNGFTSYAEA